MKKVLGEQLVFVNPGNSYVKFSNKTQYIRCYTEKKKEKCFIIPRGRESILSSFYMAGITKIKKEDNTQEGKDIDMKANFDFRDDIQKDSFNAFINSPYNMGVLNLGCGLGNILI